MKHKDFLGQELQVGDYCSFPGGGNGTGSYGLLLHKVIKLTDKSVQTERLSVHYRPNKIIKRKKSNITKSHKLTKVIPPPNMVKAFENPEEHFDLVSKWLHGQCTINWEDLSYAV